MKKLIASMLSAVMLIMSINCTAFARSHQDSYFDFYVGPGIENHSDFRLKEDDSPVYVYLFNWGPAYVDFCVINTAFVIQNSGTGIARIYAGTKRLIHTHVYENGYSYCALGSSDNDCSGYAVGAWSPDSVGSYPFAN